MALARSGMFFILATLMTPGCSRTDVRSADVAADSASRHEQRAAMPDAAHGGDGAAPAEAPELISLLGRPVYASAMASANDTQRTLFLKSIVDLAGTRDLAAVVWPGRRLGYLGRMHDAVAYYTLALERFPEYAPLYRHRGHRHISLRQFDAALDDLNRASMLIEEKPDEIEPDGMPNEKNIPLTTVGFNVFYHRALAKYLKGDFDGAIADWAAAKAHGGGRDDNLVAAAHWMYMSARRRGERERADACLRDVPAWPELIENHAYYQCIRLYRGEAGVEELWAAAKAGATDFATIGYAIGNWHLYHGRTDAAKAAFERVVATDAWAAFGFIAAEVELARMRGALPVAAEGAR